MRHLLVLALLFPTACLALGADSQEFVGVSIDGKKLVRISFVSDPQKWTGNNWIYGSAKDSKFRYCWSNETPTDLNDPLFSPRVSTHFVCASKRGVQPSVWYKHGNYSHSEKSGIRYKEAMADFKKARKAGYERGRDFLIEYYICDKGCDEAMPLFIFEVGFED